MLIDKGYYLNYKERICVYIWRFWKEVIEIKGVEVVFSYVVLVLLWILFDKYFGIGDLVIILFGINIMGFLIGLIVYVK